MSEIPPPDVYFQPDFDASSLKVAQLRGLLLQYQVSVSAASKKADLVAAFEQHVRPQGARLLATASRIQPSNSGIISVSEDGTESVASTGQKRGRGRPKKSIAPPVEPDPEEFDVIHVAPEELEPPVKKPRGRPRKMSKSAEVEVVIEQQPAPTRRRTKKNNSEHVDDQTSSEAELSTPAPRSTRGRASMPSASPAISIPSAPSSSRRRSVMPSSASAASDLQGYDSLEKTPLAKKRSEPAISFLDNLKEEEEKDVTTPKREDSGFSDFNPFQSGSEEAAERERRRRKSSIGLSAKKPAQPRHSEPVRTPKRETPKSPPATTLRRVGPSRENLKTPPKAVRDAALAEKQQLEEDISAADQYNRDVEAKLQEITTPDFESTQISIRHGPVEPQSQSLVKRVQNAGHQLGPVTSPKSTVPLGALFLLLLSFIANYKSQSASIGFCDSASNTNDIILTRQSALDNANACIMRRTSLDLANPGAGKDVICDVTALPLVPFVPRATACAPCPQHAICEEGQIVSCAPEYILTSHPLQIISPALDGIPGLGPRVFPPSCRPDTAKKRMIGGLAKSIESELAKGRGLVVCARMGKEDGRQGQGELYGVEESVLKENYAARRDPKFSQEQFEEIFEAALRDLLEHDDVIESINREGKSYYAAARTELTLACNAKLQTVDLLEQWKRQLASTAVVISIITYLRNSFKNRRAEKYKAEELVQVALRRLQDQERLHYSDPVTTPHHFIPPTQLRDLVMPPKGSTSSRTRLWQRVQDLVEANANVAVREQEVRGEMWKTWEWQGVGERHVTWQE